MLKNLLFFVCVVIFSFIIIEIGSRLILPISPGVKKTDLAGNQIDISWNAPNTTFIQISPEWDLQSTNDEFGNRIVPSTITESKTVLFLGDSFTYGVGVSDEDSIPNLVCLTARLDCINLGVPGSGMVVQRDKISDYLQRSKNSNVQSVYHLIMASTEQNYSGNDITDTNNEMQTDNSQSVEMTEDPLLLSLARWSSTNSNFVRVTRFYLGSWLRSVLFKTANTSLSDQEIENFSKILLQIKTLTESKGIEYVPLLVTPYSELANNTYDATIQKIQQHSGVPLNRPKYSNLELTPLFYPLDGHFNSNGSSFYANFIIDSYFK